MGIHIRKGDLHDIKNDSIHVFQETAARDGLMKMKTVYEANPALGDPMSIQVNILQVIEVEDSSRVLY